MVHPVFRLFSRIAATTIVAVAAAAAARWKATFDFMTKSALLKPEVDLKQAYTLQFVRDTKVMP